MTPAQFVFSLQFTDSLFPVGSFAYSDGLESAATAGLVRDAASLGRWLDHFLDSVFVPCDGLALLKCARSARIADWAAIRTIDEELTALKPSRAVRSSSLSIGKRLLTTYASIFQAGLSSPFIQILPHCNAPVAYGLVFSDRGFADRDALLAFGYTRMAGIVSAGLRLIAVGQQQGQALLAEALDRLPAAVDAILNMEAEPLRAFGPTLDIQQMNHRYVYSRLFRS
jgi:urease accessory protein